MVYKPTYNWGGTTFVAMKIGISLEYHGVLWGYNGILSSETLRIVVLKI